MSQTTTTMLRHRPPQQPQPPSTHPNGVQTNGAGAPRPEHHQNQQQPIKDGMPQEFPSRPSTQSVNDSKKININLSILWPSNFLNLIFGPRIYRLILYCVWIFWFGVGIFVLKKTGKATKAIRFVKQHANTVALENIETSPKFKELIQILDKDFTRPPAFLLLNQYALNMTFNFLCNTAVYPGVHERLIFVTLDSKARDVLAHHWPNIRQLYWPTPSLYVSFPCLKNGVDSLPVISVN